MPLFKKEELNQLKQSISDEALQIFFNKIDNCSDISLLKETWTQVFTNAELEFKKISKVGLPGLGGILFAGGMAGKYFLGTSFLVGMGLTAAGVSSGTYALVTSGLFKPQANFPDIACVYQSVHLLRRIRLRCDVLEAPPIYAPHDHHEGYQQGLRKRR
jgi:hypothetical protein